jgi:DNA replication protein DnaC
MQCEKEKTGRLHRHLTELRLPTIRRCYQETAIAARRDNWEYESYLLELAEREREERRNARTARLLKDSKLPLEKNLKAFNRKRLPRKVDTQLTQELVHQGRQVRFTPCNLLVQELLIAKRDLKLARVLKQYAKYEALIIDDIGYVQQSREEMEVLFTLLADRYERSSIMLTSNLPFSKWEQIFKDPMTTAAAIDRLVHHSVILELNMPSYRLEESQKAQAQS